MKKIFEFNRKSNPAAVLRILPVYRTFPGEPPAPWAVFVKYHDSKVWIQYGKEYHYRKCAVNYARKCEIQHYAWYFAENSVFA